jgi:hypothetical protein
MCSRSGAAGPATPHAAWRRALGAERSDGCSAGPHRRSISYADSANLARLHRESAAEVCRVRYYFHLSGPDGRIIDSVGAKSNALEHARTAALEAVDELFRENQYPLMTYEGWHLEIVGEDCASLLSVSLSELIRERVWELADDPHPRLEQSSNED